MLVDKENKINLDYITLRKYNFKKYMNMAEITDEIFNKNYKKFMQTNNFKILCDKNMDGLDDMDDHHKNKINIQVKYIKEIIGALGYENINDNNKLIIRELFEENMKKAMTECEFFLDYDNSYKLFNLSKKRPTISSIKAFLGLINVMLAEYDFQIKSFRKNTTNIINKKRINISKNYYFINMSH